MTTEQKSGTGARVAAFMLIAFLGIFIYGLLAALPGSVLPTIERAGFLPGDGTVATFLLINAIGAVLAYAISGPMIDFAGNKFSLAAGAILVIAALLGLAWIVSRVSPASALLLIFACAFVLGLGANAIVAAGHALVVDVAAHWRNAALNLLDVCFGLGVAALAPLVLPLQPVGGLTAVFVVLAALTGVLLLLVLVPRFPPSIHAQSTETGGLGKLFANPSFWLLGLALFMYIGTEVSVLKWLVSFMERDAGVLARHGLDQSQLHMLATARGDVRTHFFEQDGQGIYIHTYALYTISLFAGALLVGRLVSSFLLGVVRVNSFVLLTIGSLITTIAIAIAFNTDAPATVRMGLIVAGFGMGPIFPTSVGLASTMMPRLAGTAMSIIMGIGFAGQLVIPPAVGYVSSYVGGEAGNVRTGLTVVIAAAAIMLLFHVVLALRERRRSARETAGVSTPDLAAS